MTKEKELLNKKKKLQKECSIKFANVLLSAFQQFPKSEMNQTILKLQKSLLGMNFLSQNDADGEIIDNAVNLLLKYNTSQNENCSFTDFLRESNILNSQDLLAKNYLFLTESKKQLDDKKPIQFVTCTDNKEEDFLNSVRNLAKFVDDAENQKEEDFGEPIPLDNLNEIDSDSKKDDLNEEPIADKSTGKKKRKSAVKLEDIEKRKEVATIDRKPFYDKEQHIDMDSILNERAKNRQLERFLFRRSIYMSMDDSITKIDLTSNSEFKLKKKETNQVLRYFANSKLFSAENIFDNQEKLLFQNEENLPAEDPFEFGSQNIFSKSSSNFHQDGKVSKLIVPSDKERTGERNDVQDVIEKNLKEIKPNQTFTIDFLLGKVENEINDFKTNVAIEEKKANIFFNLLHTCHFRGINLDQTELFGPFYIFK